jgi:phospholipase C
VSWLIPPLGYDEHPPAPPAMGEWYTSQVLRTLMSNPKVWAKTVVFHTYDENDGFFDHVPPPVPPPGTPGEYLPTTPLASTAQGVDGPVGLGYRVPMLVISPFSRGGHVSSEVADHTSQLRFLEARFGVKAPNISAWRRKHTGDLTSALHMGHAQVSVPRLPSTAHDQAADMAALGCTSLDLDEAGTGQPVYPVPRHQSMPRQERRSS